MQVPYNLRRAWSLLRKVNSGDCWGAGKEFPRWVYAKGVQLPGLVTRRAYERKQWETGCAAIKTAQAQAAKQDYAAGWTQARRPEYSPATLLALSA